MFLWIDFFLRWLDEGRFPREELKFTRDGTVALGWIAVFVLPPLGAGIGAWLNSRDDSRGQPIFIAGVVVTLTCVVVGLGVSLA
jgi:hypothetical protein